MFHSFLIYGEKMLTYKIIEKNDKYIRYKYFPYGKDIKVTGGIIKINLDNKQYIIEEVAQLDKREDLSEEEINQIVTNINSLREKENFPQLTIDEFIKRNVNYLFAKK